MLSVLFLMMSNLTIQAFMEPNGHTHGIAHRGFSGAAPENTLAAFEKAIDAGAEMFELDVLLSRDGHVVVIHDATVDRTTDGEGEVGKLTLAQLRALDAGAWFSREFEGERIPTLEEALLLARGRILVNVEIKTEAVGRGIVEKTLQVIERLGMRDQVVISSFDPRALERVRELDETLVTASLFNARLQKGLSPGEVMDRVGSQGFNLSKRQVHPSIVEACHALGRPVAVYTVDDPDEMKRLIALGVDAIFTNRPDRLLTLTDSR